VNVGYAEKNSERGPVPLKLIVRVPLAYDVYKLVGTYRRGGHRGEREAGVSAIFSHPILYIYTFWLVEASGEMTITYILPGWFPEISRLRHDLGILQQLGYGD